MRLSQESVNIIKKTFLSHFDDARIFLFGSRVDDTKKGGDIDLFVITSQDITLKDELMILAKLELNGIARKIDLVLDTPKRNKDKFFQTIKHEAIIL
ncbi:MAG: nucleotidyltransferase domain-containing protein [Sulfurovum sp.]|nr:MAG: nucleotidyltransferase domain-containing protein [Sulfurovum sp.]RUM77547.1 MAG: nucleotidyltransferase domain-containing protein [Sulfurovum sp.]